jgi:hypothetical protein
MASAAKNPAASPVTVNFIILAETINRLPTKILHSASETKL